MIKWTSNNIVFDIYLAGVPLLLSLLTAMYSDGNYTDLKLLIIIWFGTSIAILVKHAGNYLAEGKVVSITVIAGYILWYSYPAFIDVISSDGFQNTDLPISISNRTALLSLICITLFFISWLFTSHAVAKSRLSCLVNLTCAPPDSRKILFIALSCSFLGLVPYLLSGFSPAQIISSIFESRAVEKPWVYTSNIGSAASPFLYLVQCLLVAGSTILWTVTQDKRLSLRYRFIIGILVLIFSLIIFFDQGTRSIIVLVISPIIISYMIRQIRKMNSIRSMLSLILKGFVAILVLVTILQFQMLFRASFTRSETKELLFKNVLTLGGTIDYFAETSFALSLVPATHDYFRESVLLQFLVSPVPRFIWPSKPVSQVVWYYTLQRWGIDIREEGGNVFPGIVGQYYMSWGWLGPVILGIMLGLITVFLDAFSISAMKQGDPYIIAVSLMFAAWIFLNFRVLSPGFLYPVIFSALMLYFGGDRKKSYNLP